MAEYIKLSSLVGSNFRVESFEGYKFKQWDTESNRMISEDKWFEGSRKMYSITTNKGLLDMSASQVGQMLEGVVRDGKADLIDKTFGVKSNGKEGIDIRYFINPVRTDTVQEEELPEGW